MSCCINLCLQSLSVSDLQQFFLFCWSSRRAAECRPFASACVRSGTPFCHQEKTRNQLWDKKKKQKTAAHYFVSYPKLFCSMLNKSETYQAPCLLPPGWGCPPGMPPHALKPPSPHPWRPLLARRTGLLEFSARTRRCCSGWRMKPQPEETDRQRAGRFL